MFIFQSVRRTKSKPCGYFKFSATFQENDKNPSDFLDNLLEALRQHMSIDHESIGQILLKT